MGDSRSSREVSAVRAILILAALVIGGIGVAASVMLISDYSRNHWVPAAMWVRLTVFSAVTLAALIAEFKNRRKRMPFWFALVGLMLVRTAVYVAVLRQVPDWPLLGFVVIAILETPCLAAVLDRLGFRSRRLHT